MIKDKQTKFMFRDIALKKIPLDWAKRRKLGFPVPFSKWIKEEKYYHKTLDLFQNIYDSGYVIYQLQENIKQRYNLEEGI